MHVSASESARVSATRPECADLGTDTSARVMQELVYMGADISKAKADVEKADFVIIQDDKTVRCDAVVSYIAHLIRNTRACRLTLILGASPWTSHGSSNQLQLVCAHVCVGCACLRATRVPGSCMRLDWARARARVNVNARALANSWLMCFVRVCRICPKHNAQNSTKEENACGQVSRLIQHVRVKSEVNAWRLLSLFLSLYVCRSCLSFSIACMHTHTHTHTHTYAHIGFAAQTSCLMIIRW